MNPILSVTGLRKRYPMGPVEIHALRGVELVVKQGEFLGVMGPSGSGKSTLLHLLGGLDEASDGQVTLGGRSLAHLSDDELTLIRRRQVGFVFQFHNLLPTLTAAENVALPLLLDGQVGDPVKQRASEVLKSVGLSDRAGHLPSQLSGGEQQRVAVARALISQPLIVLADEPTGNLDRVAGAEVLALLRRACDERQQTVVMVTHDPYAATFSDRVIFLRDGDVVHELALESLRDRAQAIAGAIAALEL